MNCESCGHENLQEARFCASCGVQLASKTADEGGSWVGRLVGGRFLVKSVLGEGGMGIVYEGEQQMGSKTRKVAIKTLHSHLSNDASVLARFHRECGTVSALEHPNTIKFYDFGSEADGTLYIAMEFIDGQALDAVIEEAGALSPQRAVKILGQICGALDEAHGQGVIHRDLKPENIVLTERLGKKDFVKVLDFGIAARSESANAEQEAKLTQQGMVLGTPPYMSPEQFTGVELDRRSDVYSLGCMAYEMLTGQLPFTATTPWQWATQHMTAQPFPIGDIPSGAAIPHQMRSAVMQALEKDPDARPATAGEFLKLLEAGLMGADASAPTEAMQAVPLLSISGGASPKTQNTETQSVMSATQGFEAPKKSSAPVMIGALVALLALGGGAVAMLGGKGDQAVADGAESASAASETEQPPSQAELAVQAQNDIPKDPKDETPKAVETTSPAPSPAPTTKPGTAPDPRPSTSPSTSPGPRPAPSPTTTPKPDPGVDCSRCVSLVSQGRLSAATSIFDQCPAVQTACSASARDVAASQVDAAVSKGLCSQAKSIVATATKLRAASQRLRKKASDCKSK
jgi:serine/threonine protein kinase